jgi:uncharacterized protein VirK/YbjX
LNKPNHPPAGVLGIGLEALLAPGAYVPESHRPASSGERPFGTLLNLFDSLRRRHDWTGAWYRRSVFGLRYLVRSLCIGPMHQRFLDFVAADPTMRAYRERDPRLLERHMRGYLNAYWHRRNRLRHLHQHYRFAKAHLPRGLFELVYAMGHASLGALQAKDGSLLTLCLKPPIHKGCEGELCLQLCDVNEDPLYSIVFSVADEKSMLMIGCLQGPRGDGARDIVRELTRNLHGMRPKQLMLSLVYCFARQYGIERVVAVCNDAHPLRRKGRAIYADYDAFWKEQHGQRIGGGWYALPSTLPHKTEAEVPSNHRAAFRRREALRREAEQLLVNALAPPSSRMPRAVVARF